jgi:hydrogenase maturation protease
MTGTRGVHVMACGNIDRADDGAGCRALGLLLARLSDRRGRRIEIEQCGHLDIQRMLDVPAGTPIVIVDAAVGIRPGRVVTVPLDDLIDHPDGPSPHSSHVLPINQVLGVANALLASPLRGVFVGLGGGDFSFGDRLSPPVARAMPRFVDAIAAAIDQFAPLRAVPAGRG